ncbi:MAG: DedA family protein [Holosporales bacterium]|jgi:membrane protein DedA with SNARE-associated domain|nr:DedA family protein [Holosporales bacterium]
MFDFFTFLKSSPEIGYTIVFLGAMIEGETIILAASALAAIGYLSIAKVAAIAFLSTLFIDQILFFLGRRMYLKPGAPLSERFPKLYKRSKKAVILLKKYDIGFILMFRFIYGIRAISPIVIALCGSKPSRFVPLNFVSAVIWTIVSCSAGYWLGDFLFDTNTGIIMSGNVRRLEYTIISCVLFIVAIVFLFAFIRKHIKNKKNVFCTKNIEDISNDGSKVEKEFYAATHKSTGKK